MTKIFCFLATVLCFSTVSRGADGWVSSTPVQLKFTRPISMSAPSHLDSYGPAFKFNLLNYDIQVPPSSREKVEHPARAQATYKDAAVITLNNERGAINFQSAVSTTEHPGSMFWSGQPGNYHLQITLPNVGASAGQRRIEEIHVYSANKLSESEVRTLLKNNLGIEYKELKGGPNARPGSGPGLPSFPDNH